MPARAFLLILASLMVSGCGKGGKVRCDDLPLAIPSARGEVAGVWDADRDRLVLFGGDEGTPVECQSRTAFAADTWAFHDACDAFEAIPGEAPPPRGRHVAVLDAPRGRMILHGGRFREGTSGTYTLLDDAWALDLATDTWTPLVTGGPPARSNHTAVATGDRLIVYGGNTSANGASFTPRGDVWVLDLVDLAWTEAVTTGDAPRARLFHASTVSDDGRTMYVYGGGGANAFTGPFYGDLWALDLETFAWTEIDDGSGAVAPDGRIWANLVYDPAGRLLLWAGHDDGALGNTNQLWAFDLGGGGWSLLSEGDVHEGDAAGFCDFPSDFVVADLASPERRNAGVAALTDDGHLVVFGGKSDCGLLDDVWSWDLSGGGWTERSRATTGQVCQRNAAECDTLCF